MDIEPSFPKNNFSSIQISDISLKSMEDIGNITIGNIRGFELPDLSLSTLSIGLSSLENLSLENLNLENLELDSLDLDLGDLDLDLGNLDLDLGNLDLDLGNLDLGNLDLDLENFDIGLSNSDKPTWETLSNAWSTGWSDDGFSNIQNALSLTAQSIDFAKNTNFGLNPFVENAWNSSKAKEAIRSWGKLELPEIADAKNSKVYLEKGQTGIQAYGQLWASQMKNCLSNLAEKAIDGLIDDGLGTLATSLGKYIDSILGENTISNIQNLFNIGKSIWDASASFGEAFKSLKDGWFLVPEAGVWSGFIGGDPKNNADAKAGLNAASQALDKIEGTLDAAISLLGSENAFTKKTGAAAANAANTASDEAGKDEAASKAADAAVAKFSEGATYSPVYATRDTQEAFAEMSLADTLKDRQESAKFDQVICRILKSKDIMSNMYDVIFTFGDTTKLNFNLLSIDPFLFSARVTGISIPGEEQVSFPTKFCGSNIDRVDNQVNYTHQSSFEILADESLYYIQYFNKLAQVDNSINSDWGKTTLDALKKALKGETTNVALAELPAALSKGKIDLYIRRGFPDAYRFWKFENIRILGPGAGIGFKREGASTMSLSYEFIFKNCYEVTESTTSSIFSKK